jgi:hypothetical protein
MLVPGDRGSPADGMHLAGNGAIVIVALVRSTTAPEPIR